MLCTDSIDLSCEIIKFFRNLYYAPLPDPKTRNYRNNGVVTSQKPALYGQRIIQAEFAVGDPLMSVLTMFYCTIEWKSATSLTPSP